MSLKIKSPAIIYNSKFNSGLITCLDYSDEIEIFKSNGSSLQIIISPQKRIANNADSVMYKFISDFLKITKLRFSYKIIITKNVLANYGLSSLLSNIFFALKLINIEDSNKDFEIILDSLSQRYFSYLDQLIFKKLINKEVSTKDNRFFLFLPYSISIPSSYYQSDIKTELRLLEKFPDLKKFIALIGKESSMLNKKGSSLFKQVFNDSEYINCSNLLSEYGNCIFTKSVALDQ